MKSMLIIGMGEFGHQLCRNLIELENEVMIVDIDENALEDIKDEVDSCAIADCTSKSVLKGIGVSNFDVCFVCLGADFKNNLIICALLKELGAKYIVSQTDDDMLEKLLLTNGANEIVYPYKDSAVRVAAKYSSESLFDYIPLADGYSVCEISPIDEWIGQSIISSNISRKYNMYILSVQHQGSAIEFMPDPNTVIEATDHLMVIAHDETMEKWIDELPE